MTAKSMCSQQGGAAVEDDQPIRFYDRNGLYYEFTNFYIGLPIYIDDKMWKTVEHYFQANKFSAYPTIMEQVRTLELPRDVLAFSRNYSQYVRSDWHRIKQDVMKRALLAKFNQSAELKQLLLATGNRRLVEASPVDSYWGEGADGKGQNNLGILLMTVRFELWTALHTTKS